MLYVHLNILHRHPVSAVLALQKVVQNASSDSYLSLGFMHTRDEIALHVLCVLCNKVLPNSSVLPAKLCRRDTTRPKYKDKDMFSFVSSVSLRH